MGLQAETICLSSAAWNIEPCWWPVSMVAAHVYCLGKHPLTLHILGALTMQQVEGKARHVSSKTRRNQKPETADPGIRCIRCIYIYICGVPGKMRRTMMEAGALLLLSCLGTRASGGSAHGASWTRTTLRPKRSWPFEWAHSAPHGDTHL